LRCQKALFSAYRADQYADPEGFMLSLGAVFEQFPDEVITYVTDPRTGIQRRIKWPPALSEVIEACEEHQTYLKRLRQPKREAVPRLPTMPMKDLPQGAWAQIFVSEGHPKYASLVEWTQSAHRMWWKFDKSSDGRDGVWVSYNAWLGELR
jgi:hypothetical protein